MTRIATISDSMEWIITVRYAPRPPGYIDPLPEWQWTARRTRDRETISAYSWSAKSAQRAARRAIKRFCRAEAKVLATEPRPTRFLMNDNGRRYRGWYDRSAPSREEP